MRYVYGGLSLLCFFVGIFATLATANATSPVLPAIGAFIAFLFAYIFNRMSRRLKTAHN